LYFPVIELLEYYKRNYTTDMECNDHRGNGISGHSFYYFWATIATYYFRRIFQNLLQLDNVEIKFLEFWKIPLLTFLMVAPAMRSTYWHGHHSLRQMFFGAGLAILWNSVLFFLLEQFQFLKFARIPNPRKKVLKPLLHSSLNSI